MIFFSNRTAFSINIWHIRNYSQLVDCWFFQQFRLNSSITVSCICYKFHYTLGYICSTSPQFLFKRCFSNELCSSYRSDWLESSEYLTCANNDFLCYWRCFIDFQLVIKNWRKTIADQRDTDYVTVFIILQANSVEYSNYVTRLTPILFCAKGWHGT